MVRGSRARNGGRRGGDRLDEDLLQRGADHFEVLDHEAALLDLLPQVARPRAVAQEDPAQRALRLRAVYGPQGIEDAIRVGQDRGDALTPPDLTVPAASS